MGVLIPRVFVYRTGEKRSPWRRTSPFYSTAKGPIAPALDGWMSNKII